MPRILLPYYKVEARRAGGEKTSFYGEARLSIAASRLRLFVLATPVDLGFTRVPAGGSLARPRLSPQEYESLVVEALEEISHQAAQPGGEFDVGGLGGLIRAVIDSILHLGRKPVEFKTTERLEARLAAYYVREVLGLAGDERIIVYPEVHWLPVEVRVLGKRRIVARHPKGEFRVLEKLVSEDEGVWRELEGLLKGQLEL